MDFIRFIRSITEIEKAEISYEEPDYQLYGNIVYADVNLYDTFLPAQAFTSRRHRGTESANSGFSGLLCGNAEALYSYFS